MTENHKKYLRYIAAIVVIISAVFIINWNILSLGFWTDDYGFLSAVQPFHVAHLPHLLDPLWGWFYRPVFLIYFAVVLRIFGPDAVAFHACSLLLHAINLLLMMALIYRLTQQRFWAGVAGITFLFLPRIYWQGGEVTDNSISAVAWISSASTLLATLFSLTTIHCWISYRATSRRRFYGLALGAFALAVCSKEDAATLPLALLAVDWFINEKRGHWTKYVRQYAPFAGFFLLYVILEIIAYRNYGAFGGSGLGGPLQSRRYNLALLFFNTAQLGLWPQNSLWIAGAFAALIVWCYFHDKTALALWLWTLATALPTTLTAGPHALAARFFYLPSIVVLMAFAVMFRHLQSETKLDGSKELWPVIPLCALVAIVSQFVPIQTSDPLVVWSLLLLCSVAALLLWRYQLLSPVLAANVVLVAVGSQAEIFGPEIGIPFFWPALTLTFAILSSMAHRCSWYVSVLMVAYLWNEPHGILPIFLLAAIVWPYLTSIIAKRGRSSVKIVGGAI
jgi:hypothetical protein